MNINVNNFSKCLIIILIFALTFMIYPIPIFLENVEYYLRNNIRLAGFLLILIIYIFCFTKRKRISKLFILSLLFGSFLIFTTIYNNADLYFAYGTVIITISEFMLYEVFLDSQYKEIFIKSSYFYYLINCFITILAILFCNVLVETVNRNHYIQYIFPQILFEFYIYLKYNNDKYDKIRYFSILVVYLLLLLVDAKTGIIVVSISYAYMYLISKKKYNLGIINNWIFQLSLIIMFFIVCVWFGDLNPIANILSMALGRPDGFSGRTAVAPFARKVIIDNMLIGVGLRRFLYYTGIIAFSGDTHNLFLQYLASGGIIAFGFLLISIIYLYIIIDRHDNKYLCSVCTVVYSLFLLRGMMEQVPLYHYFITVALLYYLNIKKDDYLYFNKIN